MSDAPQAVRGMNDVLPAQAARWQWLERCAREVFAASRGCPPGRAAYPQAGARPAPRRTTALAIASRGV